MRVNLTQTIQRRECGSCTLCCKTHEIPELSKKKDAWCQHAHKDRGCDIYEERPASCREFDCLWLQGYIPVELKPNRVHAVVSLTLDREQLVIHEDPGFRGVGRRELADLIRRFTADGQHLVAVICGEERAVYGDPRFIRSYAERRKNE